LLSGQAICQSLPAARRRQGCSEYRAYGETATERPGNTDPVGKAGMQPQGETDQVNTNKLRIPTLRGKNTDPVGKGEPLDRPQHAVRCRRWWDRYRLTAVFRGKVRAVRRRLPITDPTGKEYRSSGVTFTDPVGKEYRSSGVTFTDRSGVDYRPYWETWRIKSLQSVTFGLILSVYMMLCLCLVFCLVNREVMGG
jgi:hypothetical protein